MLSINCMCFHGRTISRCKMYMLPWFYPSFNLGVFFLTESFLWTHHFDSPRSSFHSSLRLRIVDRSNRFDTREATSAHSFPVEPEAMVSSPPPAKQPTKFVHVKFRLLTQDSWKMFDFCRSSIAFLVLGSTQVVENMHRSLW